MTSAVLAVLAALLLLLILSLLLLLLSKDVSASASVSAEEGWHNSIRFRSIKLVLIESTPCALSRVVGTRHTKHSISDAPGIREIALARHPLQNVCKQNIVFGTLSDDLLNEYGCAHISQVSRLSSIFAASRSLILADIVLAVVVIITYACKGVGSDVQIE